MGVSGKDAIKLLLLLKHTGTLYGQSFLLASTLKILIVERKQIENKEHA